MSDPLRTAQILAAAIPAPARCERCRTDADVAKHGVVVEVYAAASQLMDLCAPCMAEITDAYALASMEVMLERDGFTPVALSE